MVLPAQQRFYRFGVFEVDIARRLLLRRGDPVMLTPKAFEILLVLIQNRERVVRKDELMKVVWPDAVVEENNLTRNISSLRKALGEGPGENRFIVTVPGRGYQFAGEIPAAPTDSDVVFERHSHARVLIEEHSETDEAIEAIQTGTVEQKDRRRIGYRLGWAAAACTLLFALAWLYQARRRAALPPPRVVPVTSFPDWAECSEISPDGNYVAFNRASDFPQASGIYLKQIGTENYRQLTQNGGDRCPAWSPDGRYLAFSRHEEQKRSIYLVSTLGGAERNLFSGAPAASDLNWSPDGKLIAFSVANPQPGSYSILSLAVDTLETRTLTEPPVGYQDWGPAFSPDGKQMAFIRVNGNLTAAEIYVKSTSGGGARRMTFDDGAIIGPPAWTGDGKSILFSSTRSGLPTVWRIPASGGSPVQLTEVGVKAVHPTVAAEGHRLAFEQEMGSSSLWRLNVAEVGKKDSATQVTASKGFNGPAEFSPDARRIVLVSDRSGTSEIYICDANGSNLLQLTTLGNGGAPVTPHWSPDGQRIVFDSVLKGHTAIFVIQANGGPPRRLTDQSSDNVNPSWSHDGQWIYFASSRTGQWQIWRMSSQGADAVQLTQQGGFAGFESADRDFFYYAKTAASPEIWKLHFKDQQETAVSPRLHVEDWTGWTLANNGVFFIKDTGEARADLRLLDFGSARVRDITRLEKQPWHPRISASADGHFVLYQQLDMKVSNVMLLENFR